MCTDYTNLLSILSERHLSVRTFAKMTGIPASTISSAARAKRSMSWENATIFARALKINPQDICESYPTVKHIKGNQVPVKLLKGYLKSTNTTLDSDSINMNQKRYLTGPLSRLLIHASDDDMENIDTLVRTYLSLSDEGKAELVDLAQILSKHHAEKERAQRLKGIKKWASLIKSDTH